MYASSSYTYMHTCAIERYCTTLYTGTYCSKRKFCHSSSSLDLREIYPSVLKLISFLAFYLGSENAYFYTLPISDKLTYVHIPRS